MLEILIKKLVKIFRAKKASSHKKSLQVKIKGILYSYRSYENVLYIGWIDIIYTIKKQIIRNYEIMDIYGLKNKMKYLK